jgi:PAS domain-containing protein
MIDGENEKLVRVILDTLPACVLVMNEQMQVVESNQAARKLFGVKSARKVRNLIGEVLHCVNERDAREECGNTPHCEDCPIRKTLNLAQVGKSTKRLKAEMRMELGGKDQRLVFLISATPLMLGQRLLFVMVLEDVTELFDLRAMIPICSGCKKIRTDKEAWQNLETYFNRQHSIEFTHGICPDCARKFLGDTGLTLPK